MTQNLTRWKKWWGRPGWDRFVHVAAAWAFVLAIGLFLELATHAPEGNYLPIETKIMQALRHDGQPIGPAGAEAAVRDITALGSATVIALMTLMVLGYLWMCGRNRVAGLITVATVGGQALNSLLKFGFARERPDAALQLVAATASSFPSGHTMASSIFYLTIGALLARTARRRREKIYFIGAALLITFLIGFSRVYLGVHYPTDVMAGWSAGVAWAMICWFVADWLGRRGKLHPETGETATL